MVSEINSIFSGENAYRHLEVLTEHIGPRHGGSAKELEAAHYIRDYFKELGLKTKLEKYPIYSFEDADADLTTPSGKTIDCLAIPVSASTSSKGITKEVVFLEDADPVFLDDSIKDKIVVMFNSFGGERLRKFYKFAPAGLVSIQTNAHAEHFLGADKADSKRKFGSIPAVRLTYKEGIKLLKKLPKKLTLKVITHKEKVTNGYNVIADLSGTAGEDEVVAICAHYDSVWRGPGAIDNGGGIASIMELARIYKKKGSKRNLRFIAFGGEEMGLWGAKSYVKNLKDKDKKLKKNKDFELDGLKSELDQIQFLVNLDMMGPLHGKSVAITFGCNDIPASLRLFAKEIRYSIAIQENELYSSDNMAFNSVGIPSASFHRCGYGDGGGHTVKDVIDNCSPEGLTHIGHFVELWIDRYITQMHIFPFSKEIPEAAKTTIKKRFGDKDILDYKIIGPEKKYKKKKN